VKTSVPRDWRIALSGQSSAPLAAGPQMGQSGNHSWQQGAPKQPPGAAREVPPLPAGRAWGAGEHKLGSYCVPMAIGVLHTGGMWLGYNTGAHTVAHCKFMPAHSPLHTQPPNFPLHLQFHSLVMEQGMATNQQLLMLWLLLPCRTHFNLFGLIVCYTKYFLHPSTAIICNWSKGAYDENAKSLGCSIHLW